eukprot:SAG22_NODE_1416_length_4469_cov_3.239930_4_plen_317_part_00
MNVCLLDLEKDHSKSAPLTAGTSVYTTGGRRVKWGKLDQAKQIAGSSVAGGENLQRKSEFTAMAEHQNAFRAKFCGKDIRLVVGSVAVQIFDQKHKLIRSVPITHIPQWSTGKTEMAGTPVSFWVHLFVGEPAPHWVERRIELIQWQPPTKDQCQRLDFMMTKADTKEFTKTLNNIATQIAEGRQQYGRSETICIASKLTCDEVKTPRSAQCVVHQVANDAKSRLGGYKWGKMNGDQKLAHIKAQADRESTIARFTPAQEEQMDDELRNISQMIAHFEGITNGETTLDAGTMDQDANGVYFAAPVTDDSELDGCLI